MRNSGQFIIICCTDCQMAIKSYSCHSSECIDKIEALQLDLIICIDKIEATTGSNYMFR